MEGGGLYGGRGVRRGWRLMLLRKRDRKWGEEEGMARREGKEEMDGRRGRGRRGEREEDSESDVEERGRERRREV